MAFLTSMQLSLTGPHVSHAYAHRYIFTVIALNSKGMSDLITATKILTVVDTPCAVRSIYFGRYYHPVVARQASASFFVLVQCTKYGMYTMRTTRYSQRINVCGIGHA